MKALKFCLAVLLLFQSLTACTMTSPASTPSGADWPDAPEPDYWPTRGWQQTTPEAQGIDSADLAEMLTAAKEQNLDLHSLLVVRNGYLVLEAYFDPYQSGDVHTVESNTKTVIAMLIGMAIDQGKLESVDQKLVDFFPEATIQALDERKKMISLQHLLSMTPGLDCEDYSPNAQGMYASENWVQYMLDLPMKTEPGTNWVYCSGAAHLLSAVLERSTGLDARTYANRYLFKPLGIPDTTQTDWPGDPQNITIGVAGLYLRPSDLAKLGYLYLHKGFWDGQQIVSKAWIESAIHEHAYTIPDEYVGGRERRFGYMFSIFPDQELYGYLGRAGQELFVLPEQNLVVVFTAGLEVGKEVSLLDLVDDFLIPAVQSQSALPENPQSQEKLQAAIRSAAGEPHPVGTLPPIALEISGVTYQLEDNPFGWVDISFHFQPGSSVATIHMSEEPELVVGLDNRYRLTVDPESKSRPIGLRGSWEANDTFRVEDITLGEFSKAEVIARFDWDSLSLTVVNLNYRDEPVVITGHRQP